MLRDRAGILLCFVSDYVCMDHSPSLFSLRMVLYHRERRVRERNKEIVPMCGSAAEVKANYYQSLFADVASVSSRELLRDSLLPLPTSSSQASQAIQKPHWNLRGCNVLLIDVRSDSERAVSQHDFRCSISDLFQIQYFTPT